MKGGLRLLVLVSVVAGAVAGPGVATAGAGLLSCVDKPERPFAAWNDNSPYTLAPNGDLSAGGYGWTLTGGARVVAENNSLRSGVNSVSLPLGASATSPAACVKLGDKASRFFLRGSSRSSRVRVDIVYRTLLGLLPVTTNLGYATAGGAWQPSPKFGHILDNVIGTLAVNPTLGASIRFKFTAVSGSCLVDDLFVDPLVTI